MGTCFHLAHYNRAIKNSQLFEFVKEKKLLVNQ